MFIWKIIKKIHTKYKDARIVQNLADQSGTSEEWWNSHGRAPSTFNQQNTGKETPEIRDYLELVDLYEGAATGAGLMLSEEINFLVRCKYLPRKTTVSQRELVNALLKESTEGAMECNKKDFSEMSLNDLESARAEVFQGFEKHQHALEILDAMMKERVEKREIEANVFAGLNGHTVN